MVLVDTSDGVAMNLAYGWAFIKPIRKIYYNLTVTVISVAVALLVGTVELLQVLSSELGLSGSFWSWLGGISFETIGYLIIALFLGTWIAAIAIYRYKDFEGQLMDLP
jgi:high-affinity nickel-transport protein